MEKVKDYPPYLDYPLHRVQKNDTTSFKKVWYKHHTGKQGKRKHLKMMLVCTECHYVWDTQAFAFSYCPGCGKYVMEYEEVAEDGNKKAAD